MPKPVDHPRLNIRCADCLRLNDHAPRIGTLWWGEHVGPGAIIEGSLRPTDRVHILRGHNGAQVRYWCRRCEARNDRRSPKVVPAEWFEGIFEEMLTERVYERDVTI